MPRPRALALPLGLALALAAPAALACGGLFCSVPQGPVPPEPVDQNAERIVFDVNEAAGTVTAHVQIQYAGGASAFAWIVPVPSVPLVAESTLALFEDLDEATRLQVLLPSPEACPAPSSGGGFGCGSAEVASGGAPTSAPRSSETVTVFAHDYTDNYEYVVLGAEDTAELVGWLQDNGYEVSTNMTPVMDVYNEPGMRFLALRLRDGKTTADIVPIAMTYAAERPVIPIRLTAVAAQPLMGILVIVLADRPYVPAGYEAVRPDPEAIHFDAQGNTSYFEWAARVADEADGRRLVAEYRGANPLEGASYGAFTLTAGYASRYYTRLSPHRMTLDPAFAPDDSAVEAPNVLDLRARPTLWRCGGVATERLPSPCAFNYCGEGATCGVLDGAAACDCAPGSVAQRITGPDGLPHVTCVPEDNPFDVTDAAGGAGGPFDPCAGYPCGDGACVLRGGFPTCRCGAGALARLEGPGALTCEAGAAFADARRPGAGPEAAAPPRPRSPERRAAPLWAPLLAALAFLALHRRRLAA